MYTSSGATSSIGLADIDNLCVAFICVGASNDVAMRSDASKRDEFERVDDGDQSKSQRHKTSKPLGEDRLNTELPAETLDALDEVSLC